jgi:hypothetical protein
LDSASQQSTWGAHQPVAGEFLVDFSNLTNKPLKYFVPRRLTGLAKQYAVCPRSSTSFLNEDALALFIARECSTRVGDLLDVEQMGRYSAVISGEWSYTSTDDVIALAHHISKKNQSFRDEISFAGSFAASDAKILYAPHNLVKPLMDDLGVFLLEDNSGIDCVVISALTGYYAVHVHPFTDGNGRLSRLLAAYAGGRSGSIMRAVINVAFQERCKHYIADKLWVNLTSNGLERYLDACFEFEQILLSDEIFRARITSLDSAVTEIRRCVGRGAAWAVLKRLAAGSRIGCDELRHVVGASKKAAAGYVARAKMSGAFDGGQDEIHAADTNDVIGNAVRDAVAKAFNLSEVQG